MDGYVKYIFEAETSFYGVLRAGDRRGWGRGNVVRWIEFFLKSVFLSLSLSLFSPSGREGDDFPLCQLSFFFF